MHTTEDTTSTTEPIHITEQAPTKHEEPTWLQETKKEIPPSPTTVWLTDQENTIPSQNE